MGRPGLRRLVVDTSVMMKWFVAWGETSLDEAMELLRAHRDGEVVLLAPSSATVEVANTLRYIGIDSEDALGFLEDFARTNIVYFAGTEARVSAAISCAFAHRISVYDAMFLALAQELDCPLVTADRRAFGSIPPDVAEVQLLL